MAYKGLLIGKKTLGLEFTKNDINTIEKYLANISYITSTIRYGTKNDIMESVDEFVDSLTKNDTIVLYFSGHGWFKKDNLYLVVDDDLNKNTSIINFNMILDSIENGVSENCLIILDCCNATSGMEKWNINFSKSVRILTASEKLEPAKEVSQLKMSFLTYCIKSTLDSTDSLTSYDINAVYENIINIAKSYNNKNNSEYPIPNLIGNSKHNFLIADTHETIRKSDEIDERKRFIKYKTKRYLRKRCRVYCEGSERFNQVMNKLLTNNFSKTELDSLKAEIVSIEDVYEKKMTYAAYHERVGKPEQMVSILSDVKFSGAKECTRLFYRGLAYEKLDELNEAIEDYTNVLRVSDDYKVMKSTQFNLNICYSKMGDFNLVDYESFIKFSDIVYNGNERLRDKALVMHFIACHIKGVEFMYTEELKQTLQYELKNCPVEYIKSLMNVLIIRERKIRDYEIENVLGHINNMSINNSIGVLTKLHKLVLASDHPHFLPLIKNHLEELDMSNLSYSTKKFIDQYKGINET